MLNQNDKDDIQVSQLRICGSGEEYISPQVTIELAFHIRNYVIYLQHLSSEVMVL